MVMKKNSNKISEKKERKIFKFYDKSNEFTIFDKIMNTPSLEGIKAFAVYMFMGVFGTFAVVFANVGTYTIREVSFNNSAILNLQMLAFTIISYTVMAILGILAIVCYDRNASKYKEAGVKIAKIVIIMFLVSIFKDTELAVMIKNYLL